MTAEVGVVVATRNRRESVLATLGRLTTLPERPPIVLVDNGSEDRTPAAVRAAFPNVAVVAAAGNLGSAARTAGVRALETPFVAFSDDDSWWAPGALERATNVLRGHERVAVVAARILVGADDELDPTCRAMAASPLRRQPGIPFPAVLGFVACGAVVRRTAYLEAGGFSAAAGIGGEEELLALDLSARGWSLVYVDDVVAHHHPAEARDPETRRRVELRNRVRTAWLRRPARAAIAETWRVARLASRDRSARLALAETAAAAPAVVRARSVIPLAVERQLALLDDR